MSVSSTEKKSALSIFTIRKNSDKKAEKKAGKPERKRKEEKEPGRKLAASAVVPLGPQAW